MSTVTLSRNLFSNTKEASGSTKSSPRLASLKVLQQDKEEAIRTPIQQPPLHEGPSSNLLFSLDGKNEDNSDDKVLLTPKKLPTIVQYNAKLSNRSSLLKDYSLSNIQFLNPFSSMPQAVTTPYGKVVSSSSNYRSSTRASPPSRRTYRSPCTPMRMEESPMCTMLKVV